LHDCLHMQRKSCRSPTCAYAISLHRRRDVDFERSRMSANARFACPGDVGMRYVHLLHHGAGEATELCERPDHQPLAEIEVTQNTIQGVAGGAIRRPLEQGTVPLGPIFHGGDGECFLTLEVMEKGALGEARHPAQIVDRGGGITLLADRSHGGLDELLARIDPRRLRRVCGCHAPRVPTGRYVVKSGRRLAVMGSPAVRLAEGGPCFPLEP